MTDTRAPDFHELLERDPRTRLRGVDRGAPLKATVRELTNVCAVCGLPLAPGDLVRVLRGGRFVHAGCGARPPYRRERNDLDERK